MIEKELPEEELNQAVQALVAWFHHQHILVGDSLQIMVKAMSLGILQLTKDDVARSDALVNATIRDLIEAIPTIRAHWKKTGYRM